MFVNNIIKQLEFTSNLPTNQLSSDYWRWLDEIAARDSLVARNFNRQLALVGACYLYDAPVMQQHLNCIDFLMRNMRIGMNCFLNNHQKSLFSETFAVNLQGNV